MWIYHILFIHSSVDGHLSCFHLLAVVNSAAMNTRVQVLFTHLFSILRGYIPQNTNGNSVLVP